ncbi:uncharacterized protein LOC118778531 [Megalops cyprinoides]|uniref:uncharacterized protein LOC118778531 n=1 Tax=Megalops cyprinoides TaxID=118141 RepID=UPI001863DBFE|nr:uncharacterized protein LOC118778531 [Megalops cyprinoides]
MEEKLILAVYEYPELYNSTLPIYRNIDRKANAWRSIGALVGLSGEEAKRKWKNLRDRYIKEVKAERQRSGPESGSQKQWRYRHILEFLKPFVRDRQQKICSSPERHDYSNSDEGDDKSKLNLMPKLAPMAQLAQLTQLALVTQLTPMPQLAHARGQGPMEAPPSCSSSSVLPVRAPSRKKRPAESAELALRSADSPTDEDELFLLSLVPALKRLPPQKRCEAKIRIQQIMFEVEFK